MSGPCAAVRLSSTRSTRNERNAVYVAMSARTRPTSATAATAIRRRARNDSLTAAPASRLRFSQRVPDEPDRLDERRTETVELLAQIAHVRLDDVGVAAEVVVPHRVQDLRLGEHALGVAHEEPQQVELGRGQLEHVVPAPDLASVLVHYQVREAQGAV